MNAQLLLRQIPETDDFSPPVVPGGQEMCVFIPAGPSTGDRFRISKPPPARPTSGRAVSKERLVIGTVRRMSEPPSACQGVPHGQTKSGGIVLAVICWSPCIKSDLSLSRFLVLAFSFEIVLALSLFLSLFLSEDDIYFTPIWGPTNKHAHDSNLKFQYLYESHSSEASVVSSICTDCLSAASASAYTPS